MDAQTAAILKVMPTTGSAVTSSLAPRPGAKPQTFRNDSAAHQMASSQVQ